MSENTAMSIKDNLRKAIKEGKTNCHALAAGIERLLNEGLLEFLDLPGESVSDRLHALITLPLDKGGLNTEIWEVDALLSVSPSVQMKFRDLVHQAKQGERNDLKPEKKAKKVEAKIPPKKKKGLSDSQQAKDRAYNRAAEAIPELDDLLDEGLIDKTTASKLGGKVKNADNPTQEEQKVLDNQEMIREQIKEIVPNPLPEDPKERQVIKQEIKKAIEKTTGKVSKATITVSDPVTTAKALVKANADLDFLQEFLTAIELEIEQLRKLQPVELFAA